MDTHFAFEEQMESVRGGWIQGRYHSDDGDTVADMLSFRVVFDINPFEVGANHSEERRRYAERKRIVERLLDVRALMRRPFLSLSNGEMRRVLFARAILRCRGRLVLDDPFGGLDPDRRRKMRGIIDALRRRGLDIEVAGDAAGDVLRQPDGGRPTVRKAHGRALRDALPILEMRNVNLSFGSRTLFRDFSWTVREGERWVLRGPNGSGKTTLLALISGDAPRSYAFDISVFGKRRGEEGVVLGDIRAEMAIVSAERQVYLGESPDEQLEAAFAGRPRLLLLDEPCCNLSTAAAHRFLRKVGAWLDRHPRTAAICVAHRADHVPPGFSLELALPQSE